MTRSRVSVLRTHHSPRAVNHFRSLSKKAGEELHEFIFVVKVPGKQDLADDVGGDVVEHALWIDGLP